MSDEQVAPPAEAAPGEGEEIERLAERAFRAYWSGTDRADADWSTVSEWRKEAWRSAARAVAAEATPGGNESAVAPDEEVMAKAGYEAEAELLNLDGIPWEESSDRNRDQWLTIARAMLLALRRQPASEATAAAERRVAEVERERDAVGKAASEAMSACEQHAYDFVAQREAPERRLAAIREIAEGVGGLSSPTQILAEVRRIAEVAAGDGGA